MIKFTKRIKRLLKNRSGSPLVEETVLLGVAVFALAFVIGLIFRLMDATDKMWEDIGFW